MGSTFEYRMSDEKIGLGPRFTNNLTNRNRISYLLAWR